MDNTNVPLGIDGSGKEVDTYLVIALHIIENYCSRAT
jgi:hypothetical protein